jgi:hypothetical protein
MRSGDNRLAPGQTNDMVPREVLPIFRTTDCCFLVCFLSSLRTWERKEPVGRLKLSGSPRDLSFSIPVHIRLPDDINQSVSFV